MYNSRKAAQVAAFFAREEGGKISILKLIKLLYLADREFVRRYDCLILDDEYVSMDHGPVTSRTLNYINGGYPDMRDWWEFIRDREDNFVGNKSGPPKDSDLDELSRAELGVLAEIWHQHGQKTPWELRNWTHKNCAEWRDPNGSSIPIQYEEIFKALGKDKPKDRAKLLRENVNRAVDA